MQQQRMGVVVIGQSPRPSVVNEIAAVLRPGWKSICAGRSTA